MMRVDSIEGAPHSFLYAIARNELQIVIYQMTKGGHIETIRCNFFGSYKAQSRIELGVNHDKFGIVSFPT